jgi:hypothetical protein
VKKPMSYDTKWLYPTIMIKPEVVFDVSGSKFYKVLGKLHNENGPAAEWSTGAKHWYINDELHRLDGPAVITPDGTHQWYICGIFYTFDDFVIAAGWTQEKIAIWKLHYC